MSDDSTTLTTIAVTGHSESAERTRIEAAETTFAIGTDASPLDHLLGSLSACINVIGHLVAEDRGIELDELTVGVEGDIDPVKYRGESTDPRAGFQAIRIEVSVDTDADDDAVRAWADEVAERCPVADNLREESVVDLAVGRA